MNSSDARLYLNNLEVGAEINIDYKRGDSVLAKFERAVARKSGPSTCTPKYKRAREGGQGALQQEQDGARR